MIINQPHPKGWISIDITPEEEDTAKAIREERDRQYGNIFQEEADDARWVGDLGEMAFDAWLAHKHVQGYQWLRDNAAGKPDFILPNGVSIGIKSVKRKVPPREDYTAQITARHANEPIQYYFFLSYQIMVRKMWLLGGISRELFLKEARYYRAGEQVHKKYKIREGHEIYNIEISKLIRPEAWIRKILSN